MSQNPPTAASPPAGSPVSLRQAGPLLFSNLVWVHPQPAELAAAMTGKGHLDARDGLVKAQTAAVYAALEAALAAAGTGLERVVHQRVRVRDLRDYPSWRRVTRERYPGFDPATSIHGEGDGLPPGIDVAVEVIAVPDPALPIERIAPAAAEAATDPFVPALRCGQFIFSSALNPLTPAGEVVTEFGQLEQGERAAEFAEFAALGAQGWLEQRHAAQMLATYANLERVLAAAGSSLDGLLKHNGYVRMSMKAYTAMEAARRLHFGERQAPPATTVTVHDLGIDPAVDLTFDVVALADGGPLQRQPVDLSALTAPYGFYLLAARAGQVMFTAGELPYVRELGGDPRGGVVGTWDPDPGHGLPLQVRDVVGRLRRILEHSGAGTAGLRRLGLSLRDRRYLQAWERLALAELPGADPLVVETIAADAGPYPTCLFELDAVAELP